MAAERGLLLFDTALQEAEPLDLSRPVRLYVCGVTPYDTTHLGHAFTYVSFDLLARYLRFLGAEVRYCQNVTDIDDDVLIRAHRDGRDWRELGESETRKFLEDMRALNWVEPQIVKATAYIPQMIAIVRTLAERGYAYESSGSVYFDVERVPDFGKRLGDLEYEAALVVANERGNFPEDPHKRDPLDFILWQAQKEGEPSWESPWGPGRPGWHIECSALCEACLGRPVTVHGGGDDLRFPHHEAEIAQSEHSSDEPFVERWMHTAMVYCEGKKMSKSLGNMVFVRDLLGSHSPDAVRMCLLSHHYREAWNYEDGELHGAAALADELRRALDGVGPASREDAALAGEDALAALDDDLDAPRALEALRALAAGGQAERRAARTLATDVLGFTLT